MYDIIYFLHLYLVLWILVDRLKKLISYVNT